MALFVLSFLAGFSERWAQDTLTSLLPESHAAPPADTGGAAADGPAGDAQKHA